MSQEDFPNKLETKELSREWLFSKDLITKYPIIYLRTKLVVDHLKVKNSEWFHNMDEKEISKVISDIMFNFRYLPRDYDNYVEKSKLFIKLVENLYRVKMDWNVMANEIIKKYENDKKYIHDICCGLNAVGGLKYTMKNSKLMKPLYADIDRPIRINDDDKGTISIQYYDEPVFIDLDDENKTEEIKNHCFICGTDVYCECVPPFDEYHDSDNNSTDEDEYGNDGWIMHKH